MINSAFTTEKISYSHVDCHRIPLDEKLAKLMNFRNGIFIEVGAFDGVEQSNTKCFEDFYGWTGILIEPSPSLFKTLCTNRPHSICFQCALGSLEEDNTYLKGDFDGNLMSSISGLRRMNFTDQNEVPVRSLQSILDEVGVKHVNFFSLDTEGYEFHILKGIDFNKTKFDYLLIEIYPFEFDEITSFLSEKGYDLSENFTGYNLVDNPGWDGTHNDYLFKRRNLSPISKL